MRCTTLATLPTLLALSVFALACSEDRTPSGPSGTAKAKDAAPSGNDDASSVTDPDAGTVTNPDANEDSDGGPAGFDATPVADSGMGCACNQNPNACDQGCACDPMCGANADAGPVVNPDASPVTPFDGGVLTGDPFNAPTLAAQYAAAICAHRETCEPVFITYLPQNRQQCESETTAALLSAWTAYVPLVQAGRMAFSQSGFSQCIQSFDTARADCAVGPDPLACENVFVGNRGLNAPCAASPECGPGLWCPLAALGGCGQCTQLAPAGADCSQNLCVAGTDCLELNDGSQLCIPNTATENAACGDINTGLCRGHLQCVGAGPFTCVRPAALNAACDDTGVTADCDIYANAACNAGTCGALNVAGPGTACGMNAPTVLCNSQARCDTATQQCTALSVGGGMCNAQAPCGRGFFCQPNAPGAAQGTCNAELATGSTCQASAECAGNDYCINTSCAALSFNAACN